MHAEVRDISPLRKEIRIEVDAGEVGRFIDQLVGAYRRNYSFRGFRPGKAPDGVVRTRFQDEIESAVHTDLVPRSIEQALAENHIHPAAPGDVTDLRYQPGQPLTFTFTVDVWPDVQLKPYEGAEVEMVVEEVTEAQVEQYLAGLRDSAADEVPVQRAAAAGDVVEADIEAVNADGSRVRGTKKEKIRLLVDSPGLLPEFRAAADGAVAGETRQFTVRYPDDYGGDLRGQTRLYRMHVLEVRERHLPELDDNFAQRVSPGADLETLRARIRLRLETEARMVARDRLEASVVSRLIEENPFDMPDAAVDGPLERARKRFADEGRAVTEEELQQFYRPQVERLRRRDHLLAKVAEREGITVSDKDVDAEIESMARREGRTPDEVRRSIGDIERFREFLFERKVFDALIGKLRIRERRVAPGTAGEAVVDAEFPAAGTEEGAEHAAPGRGQPANQPVREA